MSFQCLRCGSCCRHRGDVRIRENEIEAMAAALGLEAHAFTERFTRLRADRNGLILSERDDGACVFLDDPGATCRVQAAKPRQCRDFPSRWRYTDFEKICPAAAAIKPATADGSSPATPGQPVRDPAQP